MINENNSISNVGPVQPGGLKKINKIKSGYGQVQVSESLKDRANVSEEAQLLAKIWSNRNQIPEVRQEKIDALKEQIQSGQYQINYEELANRLGQLLQD